MHAHNDIFTDITVFYVDALYRLLFWHPVILHSKY